MEKKNKRALIIGIISTLIILIGGTYALWNYFTEKTNITMKIDGDQINFNAGSDITVSNILPVYTMEEGITKDVEVYKQNGNYEAGINLYLNLKTWPVNLSDKSFRWALYKNGNYLSSGDFSGQKQGNNVKLTYDTQKLNLESSKDAYKLYLWIDAYQESNINMMNKTFTVSLYGQVTFYDEEDNIAKESIPNAPELVDGMIPIKYNYVIDEWQVADTTNTNSDWYDYYNKMWANAVLVTEGSRSKYMSASTGTTVNEGDILAYYVWVPRYRYILFNTGFEKVSASEIQIEFEKTTDAISNGTENGEYLSHPAFWWDNNSNGIRETGEELSGIWVGKFETGGETTKPLVKPNITSMRNQNVRNLFLMNKRMESTVYLTETGVASTDIHMMKNMEWGAIAYLSHSKYGTNKEISINNNSNYITGRQGNYTYNDFIIVDSIITNNKEAGKGVLASTTGNITGIYDMSGGAYEYVMGVMKTSAGDIFYNSSGFNDSNMVESKYYDLYEYGTNSGDFSRRKLGDATAETNGWYSDTASFVSSSGWFYRGGTYSYGTYAGAFNFLAYNGYAGATNGARPVLLSL